MGIDDRADRFTRKPSPGTRFQEEFLASRPQAQWAPYIDDTAICIADNIGIGSTDPDRFNFGEEAGEYYAAGLERDIRRGPPLCEFSWMGRAAREL